MKNLLILLGFLLISGSSKIEKKFPQLNHQTIDGKIITNEYFSKSKTIVIHFHLACPPAMTLLKDIENLSTDEFKNYQFLFLLENTEDQVEKFYSDEKNIWSTIRKQYKLSNTNFDVIAECNKDRVKNKDGKIIITSQCRKLSRKLRTKSSPTIFRVNRSGIIEKKQKGYFYKSNIDWLKVFINE
jgi:hypothetical protein